MTTLPKPRMIKKQNWMLVLEDNDDRLIQPQMKYWRLGRANHKSASLTRTTCNAMGKTGGEKDMKIERRNSAGGRRFLLFTRDLDSLYKTAPLVSPNNRKQTQHSTHTGWLNVTGLGSARLHHIARWSLLCKREKEKTKSSNHFVYVPL